MDEFKDIMYCPYDDIYYPKGAWLCEFCYCSIMPYDLWKMKTKRGQDKWLEKRAKEATPMTQERFDKLSNEQKMAVGETRQRALNFDSRYRAYLADKEAPHVPKCPTCGSPDIEKIGTASKVLDVAFWGFASGKVKKTFHCNNCGYEW